MENTRPRPATHSAFVSTRSFENSPGQKQSACSHKRSHRRHGIGWLWQRRVSCCISVSGAVAGYATSSLTTAVHRPRQDEYVRVYADFNAYCHRKCSSIAAYFESNWVGCADMWVNHQSNHFFHAGNATTNRIEAHWNQLKLVTGRKPSIDKAVTGVLHHQVAKFRYLELRFSSSRPSRECSLASRHFCNASPC